MPSAQDPKFRDCPSHFRMFGTYGIKCGKRGLILLVVAAQQFSKALEISHRIPMSLYKKSTFKLFCYRARLYFLLVRKPLDERHHTCFIWSGYVPQARSRSVTLITGV